MRKIKSIRSDWSATQLVGTWFQAILCQLICALWWLTAGTPRSEIWSSEPIQRYSPVTLLINTLSSIILYHRVLYDRLRSTQPRRNICHLYSIDNTYRVMALNSWSSDMNMIWWCDTLSNTPLQCLHQRHSCTHNNDTPWYSMSAAQPAPKPSHSH